MCWKRVLYHLSPEILWGENIKTDVYVSQHKRIQISDESEDDLGSTCLSFWMPKYHLWWKSFDNIGLWYSYVQKILIARVTSPQTIPNARLCCKCLKVAYASSAMTKSSIRLVSWNHFWWKIWKRELSKLR